MPHLPRTTCNYDRCSKPVKNGKGYCPDHIREKPVNQKQSHPWYQIPGYRKARNRFVRNNPHCAECGKLINRIANRHLDHKIPFQSGETEKEQWKLFWDRNNWQVLDPQCHQRKTVKENR